MKNPTVTITMEDGGVITIELYPDVAPNTVRNFISGFSWMSLRRSCGTSRSGRRANGGRWSWYRR